MATAPPIQGHATAEGLETTSGRRWLTQLPAWAASLVVHVLVLLMLGMYSFRSSPIGESILVTSAFEMPPPPENYEFELSPTPDIGAEADTTLVGGETLSAQAVQQTAPEQVLEQRLAEDLVEISIPVSEVALPERVEDLTQSVSVRGRTDRPGGVEGAMDRLTFEIATSLRNKPTLVCWVIDASPSMKARRAAVAERLKVVYDQLRVMELDRDELLLSTVVSFGTDLKLLTPEPVSTAEEVSAAIAKVKQYDSSDDFVFASVDAVARKWAGYRTKRGYNIMLIVVTDERGDDLAQLDSAIQFCKTYGIRCYCVGNAAFFGKQQEFVTWTWTEGENTFTRNLPVDRGPESVYPEVLQVAFWNNDARQLDILSAGYGPYGLTRLTSETGGLYLIAAESAGVRTFDENLMRSYEPDYRPVRLIEAEVAAHPTKTALVRAANASLINSIPEPQLAFRADTDTRLREELTEAQKPLAEIDYRLNELQALLEQGERARTNLPDQRWRAGYDLAMGRTLALRARAYGYNAVLAAMKSSPQTFTNAKNNQWRLVPAEAVAGDVTIRKLADRAREYLQRVVKDHADTPWALLAAEELKSPLGWEWREAKAVYPPEPTEMPNPTPTPQPRMPRPEPKAIPKL